jgi:hypothetical protein
MTAERAQQIAEMCAPGIEWSALFVTAVPPVIRVVGTAGNGDVLSFYHQPDSSSPRVKLHECLALSRDILNVTEAWAGGELR